MSKSENKQLKHIGIIMDGNGRWAKSRLMPRSFGHKHGMERMIELLDHAFDIGIESVTVYALSTENLQRPKEEVDALFGLFRTYFMQYVERVIEKECRLKVIGDVTLLPEDIQAQIKDAEARSAKFDGHFVNIAICYGARAEIVRATNLAIERGEKVTEESFAELLYTAGQHDPDMIIRTGKEQRLSNFLMWQAAYSELYFSEKMFPDFSNEDLDEAVAEFSRRTRRFGKV